MDCKEIGQHHASRKFYQLDHVTVYTNMDDDTDDDDDDTTSGSFPQSEHNNDCKPPKKQRLYSEVRLEDDGSTHDLLNYVDTNVIGNDKVFSGPFGLRNVVYCDYTASGRSLSFLEKYIRDEVLPDYGNTHTTTTVTSLQTTLFRHEARDIIRNAVNASEHDAVIFVGSGCTGAVHKLIHALHLHEPPVVFVGPFEHHSNILPWKEIGASVVRIEETCEGLVDVKHLEDELKVWEKTGRQMMGCFSAASNVTGILTDVDTVTILLHRHGTLAFWDYATAGPYVNIDMNPLVHSHEQSLVYKDAIFMSCHKFVGGIQTPGLLVAKKKLFRNPVPSGCGGGSVFFVRREAHRYLQEAEMREEGGTPAVVESIRAGLVFQLKEAVTHQVIMQREEQLCKRAVTRWSSCPNLVLLGNSKAAKLPIFSFLIRHPATGLYLHHNFTCALLNDMFGVQARGGCACAGPYAEDLLGIDEELAARIEDMLVEDSRLDRVHLRRYREYSEKEILRPGFARLNLPYFMKDATVDFVLEAVALVAEHGWKMLPYYTLNPETGEWRHKSHQVFKDRKWLGFINYKQGRMNCRDPPCPAKGPLPDTLKQCLGMGEAILTDQRKVRVQVADQSILFSAESQSLRWFLLPSEALLWMTDSSQAQTKEWPGSPFHPIKYPKPDANPSRSSTRMDCDTAHKGTILHTGMSVVPEHKDIVTGETKSSHETRSPDSAEKCLEDSVEQRTVFSQGLVDRLTHGFSDENYDANCDKKQTGDGFNETKVDVEVDMETNDKTLTIYHQPTLDREHLVLNPEVCIEDKTPAFKKESAKDSGQKLMKSVNSSNKPSDTIVARTTTTTVSTTEKQVTSNSVCADGACLTKRVTNKADILEAPKVKVKWHPPPKKIYKPFLQGVEEFGMVRNGDRVLVCLSGGKDSLSLLHSMRQYQFYAKKKGINFDLGAVTVDPQTSAYDPSPLKIYLKQLQVPYLYEEQSILEAASNLPYEVASICSFCSRMKRGRIYHAARRDNYNVLALGQHIDDLAESFLMSVFHNGVLRTMKAHYTVQKGDLRVIRPFVYVREKDLRQFAEERSLPVISENCPACFEAPKERHRMKQLLASQEVLFPQLFHSLKVALKPILAINRTTVSAKMVLAGPDGAAVGGSGDEEDDF